MFQTVQNSNASPNEPELRFWYVIGITTADTSNCDGGLYDAPDKKKSGFTDQ